jgi:hypothetical protein
MNLWRTLLICHCERSDAIQRLCLAAAPGQMQSHWIASSLRTSQ